MLRLSPEEHAQIAAVSHQASREGEAAPLPTGIDGRLAAALGRAGIDSLYSHQARAFHLAERGENVIVTTASASGKSLCFNLPVLNRLASDARARALYIYPTKALAQDQARKLQDLGLPFARPGIYDGDTPADQRPRIRRQASIIMTNPDMLHLGILPNRKGWQDFFLNLAYVVIDEAHTYRGVFGSHVANVLRRLRRICDAHGGGPRFLMTSATIANPVQLATTLTGLDFQLVDGNGAPAGERQIVFWNPPLLDEALGVRRSSLAEAADLFAGLLSRGVRTIVFTRTRKGTELVYKYATRQLEASSSGAAGRIAPYRGGYTPAQRREIEQGLFSGKLLGVVSTSALELGIDVGGIDAVLSVAFPGTVASLRQQWGRAGRGARPSLAVFIAGQDALDQFFMEHPEQLLERDVEAAILDCHNEQIFAGHLGAAAYEAPLEDSDRRFFGPEMDAAAAALLAAGRLRRQGERLVWASPEHPAAAISLRSSSSDSFTIVVEDTGAVLGQVEAERAFIFVHPVAVYLHMGETYQVRSLDIGGRVALVRRRLTDYYTQPKKETSIEIDERLMTRRACGVELSFGRVQATEQVVAYQRKSLSENQVLETVELELPEQSFPTEGLWFTVSEDMAGAVEAPLLAGGLHAAEHGLIALLPLLAMCDRWDIGGLSTEFHWQAGGPSIFLYDGHPGGIGITRTGFGRFEELVADSLELISSCRCVAGCPSCIQSPKCGNLNEPLSKQAALELLGMMAAAGDGSGEQQDDREDTRS